MKYVVFLRAIYVGGHAMIKIADLKKMLEAGRMQNIPTLIQSAKMIFKSEEEADFLAKQGVTFCNF